MTAEPGHHGTDCRVPAALDFAPIDIATESRDQDGRLVTADGRLVANLVRLSGQHLLADHWFLEAGFGRFLGIQDMTFRDLDDARRWFLKHLPS